MNFSQMAETAARAVTALTLAGGVLLAAEKANRKVNADVRAAGAQERIAVALERIAGPELPLKGERWKLEDAPRRRSGHPTQPPPVPNCPLEEPAKTDATDAVCEREALVRHCFNGVGVSVWVYPPGCVHWYERIR